ncbi:MAG TPA: ankryin [Planctomycetaceae bacterium]|nr:ankryin [Planctomycetaceae bacterium]
MANHPIFAPAFHGDVDAVRRILDDDPALVSVRDAKNLTPLHVAASRGQTKVAALLLEYGADIEGPSDDGDWTPLVFAAYRGHLEVATLLVERGASLTTDAGNPIHFAGQRKHKDICRMLVEHGAVDDLIDSTDSDVLELFRSAYSFDSRTVTEVLTRRPELVGILDEHWRTVLHEACTHGDTKTVRVLLKFGADPTLKDASGQTPLDRAESHRQHAVLKLLSTT